MHQYEQQDYLIESWQWNDPALRNLTDVALNLLRDERGSALDIGCGTGRLAAALAENGFRVDGIDVRERVVEIGLRIMSKRGLDVRLFTGDVCNPHLRWASGGYDVVVCMEVLEHVERWRELLARAGELLRPGGVLILSVPRDPRQFSVLDSLGGHLRRFHDEELLTELHRGYKNIVVRRLGWPSMRMIIWLYKCWLKFSGRSHVSQSQALWSKPSVLRRFALTTCYYLLKIDNYFACLPFGTNLVVRASKR
jgi:SAM-dependent methyltransferase